MDTTGGLCARHLARGESVPANSIHHRLKRSRGGCLIEDLTNLVPLCGDGTTGCHGEVEARNEYPWVVAGYVLTNKLTGRPFYVGPDDEYKARYRG
jgi:hypothetical protein